MPDQTPPVPQDVFLNVPFDTRYSGLFTTLIGGLTAVGLVPHCVLEIPGGGRNRLERIYELIDSCGVSLHDLSRVTLSGPLRVPRFNMPFELGIAYALTQRQGHQFFIFESRNHRLQASLSDLNGHDPHIHGGTQDGILRCILDCFGPSAGAPSFPALRSLTRKLNRSIRTLQLDQRLPTPFHPYLFRQVIRVAAELAQAEGLIA
ncbi:MAG TPA: hypothetical protein VKK31_05570 [Thermoanaerobaculia bacterium]|nr:hypothetical protein [Thermoanaerobaculia bacterium]